MAVGLATLAVTRRRAPAEKQTQYSLRHFACGCAGQSEDSQHDNSAAAASMLIRMWQQVWLLMAWFHMQDGPTSKLASRKAYTSNLFHQEEA